MQTPQVGTLGENLPCFGPRQWRTRLMSNADTPVARPRLAEAVQPAEFLIAARRSGSRGPSQIPGVNRQAWDAEVVRQACRRASPARTRQLTR